MTDNYSLSLFFLSSLGKKCFVFQGKTLGSLRFWQLAQRPLFFVIPAKAGIQRNVEIHMLAILNNEKCNIISIVKKLFFIKSLMDPRFRGDDKTGGNLAFSSPRMTTNGNWVL
jgi:hypothetical protein